MTISSFLSKSDIFRSLSGEQLNKLVAISTKEVHPAGTLLYRSGEPARKFYIIEKGKVALNMVADISPESMPKTTAVDVVTKGKVMGWSALVRPHILP